MSILKFVARLERMDNLIRTHSTGTPENFAKLLGISKSMLMINLAEIKRLGGPVKYDPCRRSYYYERNCSFRIGFEETRQK